MAPPPMVVTTQARRRGVGVGGFLLALVTAGALLHVGVRMKGIEVAYDLGRERRINTELEEQRRRLHIEIGMLKDPGRVVALARDKLDMGPPAASDIVRLGPDGSLRLAAADVGVGSRPLAGKAGAPTARAAAKSRSSKPPSKFAPAAGKAAPAADKPAPAAAATPARKPDPKEMPAPASGSGSGSGSTEEAR
jgi:cell division protein FtsL